MVLYTAASGWSDALCKHLPSICTIVRNRLRTEYEPARSWYRSGHFPSGDEAVILFRVEAGRGMAHLHSGQDARINVHMCLMNCDGAQVSVAGQLRNYSAGSLLAFEDRADHEVINAHPRSDRISLTIGVLHPDYEASVAAEPFPSPQQIIRFALANAETAAAECPAQLPAASTGPAMVLAAYYGYPEAVQKFLEAGTPADARNLDGFAGVHAAVLAVTNGVNSSATQLERESRAAAVLAVLAQHGAVSHNLPIIDCPVMLRIPLMAWLLGVRTSRRRALADRLPRSRRGCSFRSSRQACGG